MNELKELNIVEPSHVGYVGSLRQSGDEAGDNWFTPRDIVDLARKILNGIDLDPFSCEEANLIIGAKRIFTKEDSAFQNEWKARSVFINPPYSRGICQRAISKLIHEFRIRSFTRAVVLVNNMTDVGWFHQIIRVASRRCDFKGRISFITSDNKRISGNTRGQSFFLLSNNDSLCLERFDCLMPRHGAVYGKALWEEK